MDIIQVTQLFMTRPQYYHRDIPERLVQNITTVLEPPEAYSRGDIIFIGIVQIIPGTTQQQVMDKLTRFRSVIRQLPSLMVR